jgi:hypothetical protein
MTDHEEGPMFHSTWLVIAALLPTTGVAVLFYFVIKAMVEGDRRERLAHSQWEAQQDRNRELSTDNHEPRV